MNPGAQHALMIDIVALMFVPPAGALLRLTYMLIDWRRERKERKRIAAILSRNDRAEAHKEEA